MGKFCRVVNLFISFLPENLSNPQWQLRVSQNKQFPFSGSLAAPRLLEAVVCIQNGLLWGRNLWWKEPSGNELVPQRPLVSRWLPPGRARGYVKAARMVLAHLPNFFSSQMEEAAGSVGGLMPDS